MSQEDGLDNETVKLIHNLVQELEKEGYEITSCAMCKDKYPSKPAKCRFCGKICFPKNELNN